MDLTEVKNEVLKKLGTISQNKELISAFMQDMPEMAKISKFIASHLRDHGFQFTEKEKWFNNKNECNTLISFWISLFVEYERREKLQQNQPANENAADGKYVDPFQMSI